jgi:hypothetical protein
VENDRWYAAAGGGDLALLNRCLLAAARGEEGELSHVLAKAERSSDGESVDCAREDVAQLPLLASGAANRKRLGPSSLRALRTRAAPGVPSPSTTEVQHHHSILARGGRKASGRAGRSTGRRSQ